MQSLQIDSSLFRRFFVGLITFIFLYFLRKYDYVLFVSVVQEFIIVISFAIFLLLWNSRKLLEKNYLVFFGIACLFVGFFDFLTELSYKGAVPFDNLEDNLASVFWIFARFLQGVPFLALPFILDRRIRLSAVFASFGCVSLCLLATPILLKPFVEPTSIQNALASFRTLSGLTIGFIFLMSTGILFKYRERFERGSWLLLEGSAVCFMGSELALAYTIVSEGFADLLGRFLIVIGYYLLYRAVVAKGLQKPYEVLFQDLKREQQSSERERNFVSAILDTAGCLVIVLDTQGRIVRFNRECERITGHSSAEVLGKPFWDLLLLTEETSTDKNVFSGILSGNVPSHYENHWVTRNGDLRLISWSNTALRDAHGRVEHVIGTGIDITERRQAEQAILRAKEEWEATFDAVPDLIMILDGQHHILRANRAMAEKVGRAPRELVGKPCYEIVHGSAAPHPFCVHSRLMCDGHEHSREVTDIRVDGVFLVSVSPLRDPGGNLIGSVHVARDITERKRAEEVLAGKMEELRKANQETGALLKAAAALLEHQDFRESARRIFSECKALIGAQAGYMAGT